MSDGEDLIRVIGLLQDAMGEETDSMSLEFSGQEMVLDFEGTDSRLRFLSSMENPKVTRDGNDGIVTASKIIAEIDGEEHELDPDGDVIEVKIAGMGDLMNNDMWYTEE